MFKEIMLKKCFLQKCVLISITSHEVTMWVHEKQNKVI